MECWKFGIYFNNRTLIYTLHTKAQIYLSSQPTTSSHGPKSCTYSALLMTLTHLPGSLYYINNSPSSVVSGLETRPPVYLPVLTLCLNFLNINIILFIYFCAIWNDQKMATLLIHSQKAESPDGLHLYNITKFTMPQITQKQLNQHKHP